MKSRIKMIVRMGGIAAMVALLSGCAGTGGKNGLRMERYRPEVVNSRFDLPVPERVAEPPAGRPAGGGSIATNSVRTLRNGDKVVISLRGIPREDEINAVIDARGEVNLPYVNSIRMAGRTTSEAEAAIEKAYVEKKIYRSISVMVVAQEDEYFIRGEVMKPGKYSLTPGMTLLRAVASAGGYTDFANPGKITIQRGNQVSVYDARKIEIMEAEDPSLVSDDVIVVRRKWSL